MALRNIARLSNATRAAVSKPGGVLMNSQLRQFSVQSDVVYDPNSGMNFAKSAVAFLTSGAVVLYFECIFWESKRESLMKDRPELEDLDRKKQTLRKICYEETREQLMEMRRKLVEVERVAMHKEMASKANGKAI